MSEIRRLREKHKLTQAELAEMAGTSQPQILRLETGKRKLTREWAERLAVPLQTSAETLMFGDGNGEGAGMPVVGIIEAGQFRDITLEDQTEDRPRIGVARDERFPRAQQYALLVSGNSMDELFPDGSYVTCVDLVDSGLEIRPGLVVHVERSIANTHLVETTLKEIGMTDEGKFMLLPRSKDKRHKPLTFDETEGVEVIIRGVVTGKWEPFVF